MDTIVELLKSFQETPLTIEQAERLAIVRQAAASFAAVVHGALPDSHWRNEALQHIRRSLMAAREAVAFEPSPSGVDPAKQRQQLVNAARDGGLTAKQAGALAALLGIAPDEAPDDSRASPRRKREAATA